MQFLFSIRNIGVGLLLVASLYGANTIWLKAQGYYHQLFKDKAHYSQLESTVETFNAERDKLIERAELLEESNKALRNVEKWAHHKTTEDARIKQELREKISELQSILASRIPVELGP